MERLTTRIENYVFVSDQKKAIERLADYEDLEEQGRVDARIMKENADGCCGCAFEDVNSWEMPCDRCKRNSKDYWRAKMR